MTVTEIAKTWGPLAEPIHPDAAQPGDPVWKDNAYLAFWDTANEIFGTFHVSTSPNGTGAGGHGAVSRYGAKFSRSSRICHQAASPANRSTSDSTA